MTITHNVTLAGPGTGKTTSLINETATLLRSGNVKPSNILVLTFTRSAAAELKDKLLAEESIGEANLPMAMTLHAFSLKQLMSDAYRARIPLPLQILDDWELNRLLIPQLALICGFAGKDRHKRIKQVISEYEAGWNSLEYDHSDWIANHDPKFHVNLEQLREVLGFTLLGELPYKFREYIKSDPKALSGQNIIHLLVDEYQDLNPCDLDIIRLLAESGAMLSVFGDDDQSIYSFRQAAPIGILEFREDYPNSSIDVLPICYRCPTLILKFALDIINATTIPRQIKDISAHKDEPSSLKCLVFNEGGEEVAGLVKLVNWIHEQEQFEWKDVLVLVPSKRLGNLISQAFTRDEIPCDNWLKTREPLLFDSIRKLYAILRLSIDNSDAMALWTYLYLSKGFGVKSIEKVLKCAIENKINLPTAIQKIINREFLVKERIRNQLKSKMNTLSQEILNVSGWFVDINAWIQGLVNEVPDEDREWVEHAVNKIIEHDEDEDFTPEILLQKIQAANVTPDIEPETDRVRLMTMHKAKGLSSKCVIIPFMEDENLIKDGMSPAEVEERRRLVYVSVTRSKQNLFITYSRNRIDSSAYTSSGRVSRRRRIRYFENTGLSCNEGRVWLKENT